MHILIAGGGIGGLAAALFLHARGFEVTVCEAAADIRELGVGINIQPHAVRELARIGLDGAVLEAGNSCTQWVMHNRFGQLIWREPRGLAAGHASPQVSIHRGRLQGVLLEAVQARLPPGALRTGCRLIDHAPAGAGVRARFATGEGDVELEADVLIGADGLHSALRRSFYPDEGPPIFANMLLWRGMTRMAPYLDGATMTFAGFREQKFIAYPITRPDAEGLCWVNWIAEIHADRMLHREDWTRQGRLEDFLPAYADWGFPWLDVPAVIAAADAVYEYPMVDRDPLPRWTWGPATLLGDAAHPMYPIGANGASQAIRDGAALAEALDGRDVGSGLAAYEAARREATGAIVLSNRGLGPEQVMQIVHDRAPEGFERLDDVISPAELESVSARYRQVTWADAPAKA